MTDESGATSGLGDNGSPSPTLAFDAEALLGKYRAERDKRLRSDAADQYVEMKGRHAHFRADPYVDPGFTRAPLTDDVEVVVVGGGFGGLLAGARLRMAGIEQIRVIERGGDFGGTWYWNRYPGAACDVESYVYLPLLEEVGVLPSRKYAPAAEILEHCRRVGRKFDLYRDACFQTEVTDLRWDDNAHRWMVQTSRGDSMRARFVVMANGPLDRPKLPGIPGLETFKGHSFHTSRWDYDYTGGAGEGDLTGLKDKVVGIIGTGATAVQCIPHLGESAKHLYVFQRTPSSIDVRNDRPTDPEWAKSLEPGWQEQRIENFTLLTSGGSAEVDLVKDGWTEVIGDVQMVVQRKIARGEPMDDPAAVVQVADLKKMQQVRARVDALVKNPATAEALKPWYNQFCKRPCFHDQYLQTFNRPNVTLVDTGGKGVERITENGLVVDGHEYALDCLIFGTGFEVSISFTRRIGHEVYGRGGLALSDRWRNGAATLHGFTTRGFPNLFIISHIQSGFSYNFPHMLGEQAKHVGHILGRAIAEGIDAIEVTQEAEDAWVAEIDRTAPAREAFLKECTPSYFNGEGDLRRLNARNSPYGGGPMAFIKTLEAWRAAGDMPGFEVTRAGVSRSAG